MLRIVELTRDTIWATLRQLDAVFDSRSIENARDAVKGSAARRALLEALESAWVEARLDRTA